MAIAIALFDNFATAQNVVEDLVKCGFGPDEISLVANAVSTEYAEPTALPTHKRSLTFGESVTVDAFKTNRVDLVALAVPGMGLMIGAGPLMDQLTGEGMRVIADTATDGIAVRLMAMGVQEEEAHLYEDSISIWRGATLIAVQTSEAAVDAVSDIMCDCLTADIPQRRSMFPFMYRTAKPYGVHPTLGAASRTSPSNPLSTS